jgi:hypothetical protein
MYGIIFQQPGSEFADPVLAANPMNSTGEDGIVSTHVDNHISGPTYRDSQRPKPSGTRPLFSTSGIDAEAARRRIAGRR